MSLKDYANEPKDVQGTRQIISNEDGQGNRSQAWMGTPEFTREQLWRVNVRNGLALPATLPTLAADAVVWLSVAAVIAKSVRFVNWMIKLGYVSEMPAALSLGVIGLIALSAVWITLDVFPAARKLVAYRCTLFLLGIVIGVLP